MPQKEVKIKVATDVELEKVKALEDNIKQIKREKLQLEINTNTSRLEEVKSKIGTVKDELKSLKGKADVDDSQVKKLELELESLESEKIDLELAIETGQLEKVRAEIEEIDDTTIDIDANMSMQNIAQGITQAKQGISELKESIDEVQQAGMQSEQNKAFLSMNLGAEKAKETYQQISDIVASMPGDDNTMRSVLSTAQALGNNLNTDEMRAAAATMADYMSASATMGKMAKESEQDIMKYLLDGNTAELERGSIVSTQVDKLKEATTFQERQVAMQQVLNDLGYGGISQQDTMLNKQAEWEGMLYNSQDALSSMWLGAEKGAMDFILKLNDSTNGLAGMAIVAGQMAAGPVMDLFAGLGQIGMGIKTIKDLGFIQYLKDLEIVTKLSAAADWLLSAAQGVLNAVMSMNPIVLVVLALIALAAALIWAYQNVDWFREMVDNAWASLVQIAQAVYSFIQPAIQWLSDLFNNFTSQIGLNTNDWLQAILGFILFIPQLPLKVGIALVNALAKVLGFKGNFVQSMVSAASNAINGFVSYITQLPKIVMDEFNRVLGLVNDFINTLPDRVWDMGAAIIDALKRSLGIGSPGHMFYMVEGELKRIENLPEDMETDITRNISQLGTGMVDSFNPNLDLNANAGFNGTGGDFIVNVYGDIDNDKRVREIVDTIRRELSWNNRTAGRSV